jgi:hypothetical protein
MTDLNGGAPAPADTGSVPIENIVSAPTPIDSAGPEPKQVPIEPDKPSTSVGEAIKKAEAKLEAKAAEQKVDPKDAKPEVKIEPKPRDETTGKFASKEAAKPVEAATPVDTKLASEPPARFSDDAKAIWKDTPEPIRRESERAIRELTQGIEKHRVEAETLRQERVRIEPFHEMAKQAGTTVEAALKSYTDLDKLLHTDKLKGIEAVLERVGVSPRDYAAHILNQAPDQQASQSDATIRELKQQIQALTEQVGGVTQTFQQQREQSTLQEITAFAEKNTRFDELADDIAFFMKTGRASNLSEAYGMAERLNPAPQREIPQTAPVIPATDAEAHTRGTKSITGAPPAGSSLAAKKPSSSVRDALKNAMARAS